MKKIIIILFLTVCIFSCNKKENKIKSGIEKYLKENEAYPDNYEFLKFKIIDSINDGELFEHNLRTKEFGKDYYYAIVVTVEEYSRDSLQYLKIDKKIEDYKKTNKSKKIISYIVKQKFRVKDKKENLSIEEREFVFDEDYNLLDSEENEFLKIFKIKSNNK